jgi:hypothetical protein
VTELELPHLARRATRLLASQARADGQRPVGNRAAAVAALAVALRNRRRQRLAQRLGRGFLAAAAVAAVAVLAAGVALRRGPGPVVVRPPSPPVLLPLTAMAISLPGGGPTTVVRAGRSEALPGRMGLQAGDRVRTGRQARLAVALSSGTRLTLAAEGDLELGELGSVQRFLLRGGRVKADVARLGPAERFLIDTSQAEVEVRGTSFEVILRPPGPLCPHAELTEVRVLEGSVAVRDQAPVPSRLILSGSTWQTECPPAPAASKPASPASRHPVARPRRPAFDPDPFTSTLHQQNNLFGAALEARRRGDSATARSLLDELLRRHPTGPLVDSARLERRELADP